MLTHLTKSAITSSGSFPDGGISYDSNRSASMIKLPSTSPGTIACPDSPPSRIRSRESRTRPPFTFSDSDEWHS